MLLVTVGRPGVLHAQLPVLDLLHVLGRRSAAEAPRRPIRMVLCIPVPTGTPDAPRSRSLAPRRRLERRLVGFFKFHLRAAWPRRSITVDVPGSTFRALASVNATRRWWSSPWFCPQVLTLLAWQAPFLTLPCTGGSININGSHDTLLMYADVGDLMGKGVPQGSCLGTL